MQSPRLTDISTSNRTLPPDFTLFMLDKRHRSMRRNGVLVETDNDVVIFAEIAIQVFECAVGCLWLRGGQMGADLGKGGG